MNYLRKLNALILSLLLAFIVSALATSPVLADDTTPPPAEVSTEETLPTDLEPASPPSEESAPETGLLSQVPEGTQVVVVNAEGEAIPLATEEAAQAMEIVDPIWCPTGKAPKALTGGCSNIFPDLATLVASFTPTGHGVIWIEDGADGSGSNILINGGGNWASAASYSLTLKGGWDGNDLSTAIIGNSTFSKSLAIIDWEAPVTLSNIAFLAVPTSTGTSALEIKTTGNIRLDDVDSILSGGTLHGVLLDNTATTNAATVIVNSGSFSANGGSGLIVNSDGAITVNFVVSNSNDAYGVYLDNTHDNTASPIAVSDSGFANNTFSGLYTISNGAVTLKNLSATGNTGGAGVYVNNTYDASTSNVSLLNTALNPNRFNDNGSYGLYIYSKGTITAKNVVANGNGSAGAYFVNYSAITPKAITLSGYLEFKSNDADGLGVLSSGVVTLGNLTANNNLGNGVYVQNDYLTAAAVNINGTNNFTSNTLKGLHVVSLGAIKINNTTAINNGDSGIYLKNNAAVSPQNITITGFVTAIGNIGDGLYVLSTGLITTANITANNNHETGAFLSNISSTSPKAITLIGVNIVNDNWNRGLQIISHGAVTISKITAIGNVTNSNFAAVEIHNMSIFPGKQMNVTISGYGVFENNGFHGLEILTAGAVLLSNITANENGFFSANGVGDGVQIDNITGTIAKPITFSGNSSFNGNDGNGVQLYSDGTVTMSNVTASSNNEDGVFINNSYGGQSKVTINGFGLFEHNGNNGLNISSHGAVTLANLIANYNDSNGVYVNTIGIIGPQAVTLNGTSNFNFNGIAGTGAGLIIYADGNIKVNNITANNNQAAGIVLDNYLNWSSGTFATYGSITLTGFGSFTDSVVGSGLVVATHGSVSLTRVTADNNGNSVNDNGITIYADHDLTITCSSAANNFDNGLFVNIAGKLTIKGFYGYSNADDEDFTYGILAPRTGCP